MKHEAVQREWISPLPNGKKRGNTTRTSWDVGRAPSWTNLAFSREFWGMIPVMANFGARKGTQSIDKVISHIVGNHHSLMIISRHLPSWLITNHYPQLLTIPRATPSLDRCVACHLGWQVSILPVDFMCRSQRLEVLRWGVLDYDIGELGERLVYLSYGWLHNWYSLQNRYFIHLNSNHFWWVRRLARCPPIDVTSLDHRPAPWTHGLPGGQMLALDLAWSYNASIQWRLGLDAEQSHDMSVTLTLIG